MKNSLELASSKSVTQSLNRNTSSSKPKYDDNTIERATGSRKQLSPNRLNPNQNPESYLGERVNLAEGVERQRQNSLQKRGTSNGEKSRSRSRTRKVPPEPQQIDCHRVTNNEDKDLPDVFSDVEWPMSAGLSDVSFFPDRTTPTRYIDAETGSYVDSDAMSHRTRSSLTRSRSALELRYSKGLGGHNDKANVSSPVDVIIFTQPRSSSVQRADNAVYSNMDKPMQRAYKVTNLLKRMIKGGATRSTRDDMNGTNTTVLHQQSLSAAPTEGLRRSERRPKLHSTALKSPTITSFSNQQQISSPVATPTDAEEHLLPHQEPISLAGAQHDTHPPYMAISKNRPTLLRTLSRRRREESPLPPAPWNPSASLDRKSGSLSRKESLPHNATIRRAHEASPTQNDAVRFSFEDHLDETSFAPHTEDFRGRSREKRLPDPPSNSHYSSNRTQYDAPLLADQHDGSRHSIGVKIVVDVNDIISIRVSSSASLADVCRRADKKLEALGRVPLLSAGTLSYDNDNHRVRITDEEDWAIALMEMNSSKIVIYLN